MTHPLGLLIDSGESMLHQWTLRQVPKTTLFRRDFDADLGAELVPIERDLFYQLCAKIVVDDAAFAEWEASEDARDSFLEMTR